MHDENSNEKSFIMISNSENIKKKAKKALINSEIKEIINKASFQFMYSKIYQLFQQQKNEFFTTNARNQRRDLLNYL